MATRVSRRSLTIELAGAGVPSIMLVPEIDSPAPAVLLLHGYSSSKERLSNSMGKALAARGIVSLAIDLPLHGDRDDAILYQARTNSLALIQHWNKALAEAKAAVHWLAQQSEVDSSCITIAGYSLGSYVALQTAAQDDKVAAVLVAAGGDLPDSPWTMMVRLITDPLKSVRALRGRPLLMLHGKSDRTIPSALAERLYDAASAPREIKWYNSGHVLPAEAAEDAAQWLVDRFRKK